MLATDNNVTHGALLTTSVISAGVAIIISFSQMEKYFETWILYRTTAESLRREKFLFQNSCANYYNLSEVDKNRLLVERVEAMLSSENSKFFAFQQQIRQLQQQSSQGTAPDQSKSTTAPDQSKSTTAPDQSKSTTAPDQSKSTTAPDQSKSTTAPDQSKSTTAPDQSKSTTAPDQSKSTTAPDQSKSTTAPDQSKPGSRQ